MSTLFALRYGTISPRDVVLSFIREHPECTRGDIQKGCPSVSCENHLVRMVRDGDIIRSEEDRVRYRVAESE